MTFREIRDIKFKILFSYYFQEGDIDSVLFNFFDNMPYEDAEDDNEYTNNSSKGHQNVARVVIADENDKNENESDKAVVIELDYEQNIQDVKNKIKDLLGKIGEIDKMISDSLSDWDLKRVGKTEITIIRLAVYEIYFDSAINSSIAINEAVELAKTYCDAKASKFINGVLATILRKNPVNE